MINPDSIQAFLDELEVGVMQLGRRFPKPEFVEVNGMPEWRHDEMSDLLLSYLKCVRSLSSLNAAVVLLRHGYVQEVGVLCRCVDEYCEDVLFLATPLGENGSVSQNQTRFVEEFFQEEFSADERGELESVPRHRVPRDKVRAAIARIEGLGINPHDAGRVFRTLGKAFSGYVHAAYVHIMELYGGPALGRAKFHVRGMLGTPRIAEWQANLSHNAYRFAIALEVVAKRSGDIGVMDFVRGARGRFEQGAGVEL
jgi:hypothetical protein